jgi:hypothetical protein
LFNTEADCLLSPTAQFARVNDNGSIGIPHICQRALSKNVASLPRSGGLQSAGAIWRSPFLDSTIRQLPDMPGDRAAVQTNPAARACGWRNPSPSAT